MDEINYLYRERTLDPTVLYSLITTNPASILQLKHDEGSITPQSRADIIAVRDRQATPCQTLAQLTSAEIELVMLGGRVQVVSPTLYLRLPEHHRAGLHLLQIDGHSSYVGAPLPELFLRAEQVLGDGTLRLGNKEVRHAAAL